MISSGHACRACLGPVNRFELCYACYELFHRQGAPQSLRERIVPMSAALSPGTWYSWLQTYKAFHPERGGVIAALAFEYTNTHTAAVASMLGGTPSCWTIVPSKRGRTYESQPFQRTLSRIGALADRLRETLRLMPGERIERKEYKPQVFECVTDVTNKRVLLLEDTWVTGATAVSAAGALLRAGAASVAIMPVARMVETSFWPEDHPYLVNSRRPYDPWDLSRWPR